MKPVGRLRSAGSCDSDRCVACPEFIDRKLFAQSRFLNASRQAPNPAA
jgi:hypothetical protein